MVALWHLCGTRTRETECVCEMIRPIGVWINLDGI